jgi:hypothetical protein
MPIPVALFQHEGYAFDPGDVSFGESESKDILINRGGLINKVKIRKESVTFKLKGATDVDLQKYEAERTNNVIGLINGSVTGADIPILGKTIYAALLTDVKPTAPIAVNGITIFESIDLEYQSQVYT